MTAYVRNRFGRHAADTDPGENWRQHATCRDEDPELFFPIGTSGPALLQVEQAKAVCRRCPVMDACRDDAVARGEVAGVWGGLSDRELAAERRRRTPGQHRPECGTYAGYKRHLRHGEQTCPPCRAAASAAKAGRSS